MSQTLNLNACNDLVYYGNSDLLAQITSELTCYPDSCLAKNIIAWYNAEYSALSSDGACTYQVAINESLCPNEGNPESIEDMINTLVKFSTGKSRRVATSAIRIAFREALRIIALQTSTGV